MATITVGSGHDSEVFTVHEDMLRRQSAFFNAALDKKWQQTQKLEIELPHDDVDVFEIYLEWLYSGRLDTKSPKPIEQLERADHVAEYSLLARIYVFGEKVQDENIRDTVITVIILKTKIQDKNGHCWFPDPEATKIVYDGTPSSSPTRRLITDFHAKFGNSDWLPTGTGDPDFAADLPRALLDNREAISVKQRRVRHGNPCLWHVHRQDEECVSVAARLP